MFRKLFGRPPRPRALLLGGALCHGARPRAGAGRAAGRTRAPRGRECSRRCAFTRSSASWRPRGIEAALTLEGDLFPGAGGAAWAAEANRINGADRLTELFEDAFPVDLMAEAHAAQVTEFLHRPARRAHRRGRGCRAARLPRARGSRSLPTRAFREAVAEEDSRGGRPADRVHRDQRSGGERNVSGALNSNFAFLSRPVPMAAPSRWRSPRS